MPRREGDSTISSERRLTAIGRIAAGIVHDANNALAVAIWNLERAARSLAPGSKEAECATIAAGSALKAAGLLRRVLEYSGRTPDDPDLVNLDEVLARLFIDATPTVENDVRIDCQVGGGVGPVVADEMLLELGLLDLVVTLSHAMVKDGSITLRAADLPPDQAPPEAPNAKILLAIDCASLTVARLPSLQETVLHEFAALADGALTVTAGANDRCEIRLYLPRAVASSRDGEAFV